MAAGRLKALLCRDECSMQPACLAVRLPVPPDCSLSARASAQAFQTKASVVPSSMPVLMAAAVGEVRHCRDARGGRRGGGRRVSTARWPPAADPARLPAIMPSSSQRCGGASTHPVVELGGGPTNLGVGHGRPSRLLRRELLPLRRRRLLRLWRRLPLLRLLLVLGRRKGVQACRRGARRLSQD